MINKHIIVISIFISVLLAACGGSKMLRCNLHVIEVMSQRNIYIPQTNANGIDNYLKKSSDWTTIPKLKNKKLDHGAAYKAARSGKTVLAAYNTGSGKSGHIVVIYGKKKMQWSQTFKAQVPYASGSVQGRNPSITLLSQQFSADKEPKMNYYIYNKK